MLKLTQGKITASPRDRYGSLTVDLREAIWTVYPDLAIEFCKPGCFGHSGELLLDKDTLTCPDGEYESNKHYHSAGTAIFGLESARRKLNISPLFLIRTYAYNGDYNAVKDSFFLLGRNEDGSYFVHKLRPSVGKTADFNLIRRWVWRLKDRETVAARQGDLVFIPRRKAAGKKIEDTSCKVNGHHLISAAEIRKTKNRVFALDPIATHAEHATIQLEGWYEVRPARAWKHSAD